MGRKRVVKPATTKAATGKRTARKAKYSAKKIENHVERLREQAARLAGLARQMEDAKLEILVDGHAMLKRGLDQVDNFADNTTRAVREAKNAADRG